MATISATATAVPGHRYTQAEIMDVVPAMFPLDPARLAETLSIYRRAAVERRFSVMPVARFPERRSPSHATAIFREHAPALAREAAVKALAGAGLAPRDVDVVITVSCTGVIIPPLEAILANDLGFRADVRRLPITELGCAGGGAALALASDLVRADRAENALVVAVELCSLHFHPGDTRHANVIATGLFGDGAAAAVVTARPARGARVLATKSHLIAGSMHEMGFDLEDEGLRLILSKHVPDRLHDEVAAPLVALLAEAGVSAEDLSFFAIHPGGRKILERVEDALGLPRERTQPSWDVLRSFGNLSSAAVIFVLHQLMTGRSPAPDARGVLAAFGPGLSAELLLLQWIA
jgi:alkylresorcinol/alkylpyrone synthase